VTLGAARSKARGQARDSLARTSDQALGRVLASLSIGLWSTIAAAETATYHFHQDNSSTSGLRQLQTANPNSSSVTLQSINLKNQPTGEYVIKEFDTQAGVPNLAGTIASGATVSVSVWVEKTGNWGTIPKAKIRLNGPPGTRSAMRQGRRSLPRSGFRRFPAKRPHP